MKTILQTLAKSLLTGVVYTTALVLGGAFVKIIGMSLPATKDPLGHLLWAFVGGVIMGLSLGPIAASMPAGKRQQFAVWASLIFFNLASVAIEGSFYAPALIGGGLPALLLQQVLAALATGWIITALFVSREPASPAAPAGRSLLSWTWRFAASALVYVLFYFVFGGINYALVTKPYYETHAGGLALPVAATVLQAEVVRGALIALSVLPFLLTVRTSKMRRALLTGWIIFAIGGLVPLTAQVGTLPLLLLAASALEIFFQNFTTGMIVSRLLGSGRVNRAEKEIPTRNSKPSSYVSSPSHPYDVSTALGADKKG